MTRVFPLTLFASLLLAGSAFAQNPQAAPGGAQSTPAQSTPAQDAQNTGDASYAIGHSIGSNMRSQGVELDVQQLVNGLTDALQGKESKFSDEQVQAIMGRFQQRLAAKAQAEQNEFLAENAKKPGVKVLPSGLQYKVIEAGQGESPEATDTVVVHYRGRLTNGKVFDSSYEREMPATFQVNRVIKGWQEALQLMKPGAKWQLFIPADLAYGQRGTPDGTIPPNSTLVFDVELLSVK